MTPIEAEFHIVRERIVTTSCRVIPDHEEGKHVLAGDVVVYIGAGVVKQVEKGRVGRDRIYPDGDRGRTLDIPGRINQLDKAIVSAVPPGPGGRRPLEIVPDL